MTFSKGAPYDWTITQWFHPLTCPNRGDGKHVERDDRDLGELSWDADTSRWVCLECDYVQYPPGQGPSPVLSREWLHCLATSPDGAPLGYFRLVSGESVPRLEIRTDGDSVRVSIPGAYLTTGDTTHDFDSLILQPDGGVLVRYGDGETAVIR